MIIPDVQMAINKVNNLGFTAFFNMIKDGRLNVVTAIINDKIVPNCAPFASNASATGIVPKISAYIGIPTSVAKTTPNGLLLPKILSIHVSGIQIMNNCSNPHTDQNVWKYFLNVPITCSFAFELCPFWLRQGN